MTYAPTLSGREQEAANYRVFEATEVTLMVIVLKLRNNAAVSMSKQRRTPKLPHNIKRGCRTV